MPKATYESRQWGETANVSGNNKFLWVQGGPCFLKNTLLLYQQDLQLGPYFVKWQPAIDQGLPRFNNYSGSNSKGGQKNSENVW